MRKISVMADAGQHIEQRPLGRRGEADGVGGHNRHTERRGHLDEHLIGHFLVAAAMTLQFDAGAVASKKTDETIEQPTNAVAARIERGSAGERHKAARHAVEFLEGERALTFRRAHLHARDQTAQIAVPVRALAQDGENEGLVGRVGLVG